MTVDRLHLVGHRCERFTFPREYNKCKICGNDEPMDKTCWRFDNVCGSHRCRVIADVCDCYMCKYNRMRRRKSGNVVDWVIKRTIKEAAMRGE